MLQVLLDNISHNLFKPLLLFFYAGFMIPVLGIAFDFPQVIYQGLTIYLLLSIGWRGGEELAGLPPDMLNQAGGFMLLGFVTNLLVGIATYYGLRWITRLRRIDAAAVAGHYGSDSAGTFVTCVGVLSAGQVAFASYMPVLLAVMEVPGCLVAIMLVSHLRRKGMDAGGNLPDEAGYQDQQRVLTAKVSHVELRRNRRAVAFDAPADGEATFEHELVGVATGDGFETSHASYESLGRNGSSDQHRLRRIRSHGAGNGSGNGANANGHDDFPLSDEHSAAQFDLEEPELEEQSTPAAAPRIKYSKLLHEVFLNPGTFLLFAGLAIGFVSRLQGEEIVAKNDTLFVSLFQGMLCLFLLEMGMTASKRLRDLKSAGWQFVVFALVAPNVFAVTGITVVHLYALACGYHLDVGTYVLFAVLCASASYIAVPAIQRIAIPEASPTLPLAAALGITFSYNVTIGIPVYLMIATALTTYWPTGV